MEPQFAEFGKEVVLFAHITNQIAGHPDDDLLVRKGRSGFPSFVMMDADGEVLAIGGQGPNGRKVEGFEATVATAQELHALAEKGKAGDAAAQKEVLLKRIGWGAMPFADAAKAVKALKLSDEEMAAVKGPLLTMEINSARMEKDPKQGIKILRKIQEEGRAPTDASTSNRFWLQLSRLAETAKDAETYAMYVEHLKGTVEAQPRMAQALARAEQTLAKMREVEK